MKTFCTILIFSIIMTSQVNAQEGSELPYYQIPDYPEQFDENTVAARMVDGLGFRYYWATKDLRKEDLDYKPSDDGRTTYETLQHIYGLSNTVVNSTESILNSRTEMDISYEELRKKTLANIEKASIILKKSKKGDMDNMLVKFQGKDGVVEYPFWNMVNGPIADAIYHTGQVVAFRRASGNPIQPGVRMLLGKATENK